MGCSKSGYYFQQGGVTTELLWFLAGKDAKFEPIDYQPQELPEFK